MDTVHINLGNDSYDVIIDSGIIGRLGKETAPLSGHGRAVIITEEGIDELYGQDLKRQLEKENRTYSRSFFLQAKRAEAFLS